MDASKSQSLLLLFRRSRAALHLDTTALSIAQGRETGKSLKQAGTSCHPSGQPAPKVVGMGHWRSLGMALCWGEGCHFAVLTIEPVRMLNSFHEANAPPIVRRTTASGRRPQHGISRIHAPMTVSRPRTLRSVSSSVVCWFLLTVAILGVLGLITYRCVLGLVENIRWVSHTHEVIAVLNDTIGEINDLHAGQRGYLLTGQKQHLLPYNAALPAISRNLRHLRQLTLDNPEQQDAPRPHSNPRSSRGWRGR